jgi:predicted TIM-barrel fold metal-dependent hydrolase
MGGLVGVGAMMHGGRSTASETSTRIDFAVPSGACDCHTHIIGDYKGFLLSPSRTYTPPPAPPSRLLRLHQALGVQRVVVVTPSAYGTNNSATLWGVSERGVNARAVVVVDGNVPDHSLDLMQQHGVRGARLYLADADVTDEVARTRFKALAARLRTRDWHMQIFTAPRIISALADLVLDSPIPVVFDHFGGMRGDLGVNQAGFSDLLGMIKSGNAYVKISAAYRFSSRSPDFDDMAPLVHSLINARQDRVLWGTDWPHTSGALPGQSATAISPLIDVDDSHLLNLFGRWVPETAIRHQILVDNPVKLYGF